MMIVLSCLISVFSNLCCLISTNVTGQGCRKMSNSFTEHFSLEKQGDVYMLRFQMYQDRWTNFTILKLKYAAGDHSSRLLVVIVTQHTLRHSSFSRCTKFRNKDCQSSGGKICGCKQTLKHLRPRHRLRPPKEVRSDRTERTTRLTGFYGDTWTPHLAGEWCQIRSRDISRQNKPL